MKIAILTICFLSINTHAMNYGFGDQPFGAPMTQLELYEKCKAEAEARAKSHAESEKHEAKKDKQ